jgi:hypothetical protein
LAKGPKVPLYQVIDDLIKKFGPQISRKDLKAYQAEHNVSLPAEIRNHRSGRGFFNLETMRPALYTQPQGDTHGAIPPSPIEPEPEMTDEEIESEINSRFASLDLMTYGVVKQDFRALIVSGNPGTGKTYTLEYILQSAADASKILFTGIRGFVRATGLYRLLWEHREKECVLMFDDADSIFQDEVALNLLKAALDTTKKREISWRSEKVFEDEGGETIPQTFQFNGAVIFVSNIDFQRAVAQGSKISPHLEALMSRSYYLDLNMRSVRELIVRIKSVVAHSDILSGIGIKKKDQSEIVKYIEENQNKLREVSLRAVIKLGNIWKAANGDNDRFLKMANATTLIRGRR